MLMPLITGIICVLYVGVCVTNTKCIVRCSMKSHPISIMLTCLAKELMRKCRLSIISGKAAIWGKSNTCMSPNGLWDCCLLGYGR